MCRVAFKTNPHEIDQATFAAIMLRHMVELTTGKLNDGEYQKAESATAERLRLKLHGDQIDLRHMSAGTLSYISSQIADSVATGCARKTEAIS